MNLTKIEILSHISVLEKTYTLLANNNMKDEELLCFIPVVSKLCRNLSSYYQDNVAFSHLAQYVEQLQDNLPQLAFVKGRGYKLLHLIEAFETALLKTLSFCLYLDQCKQEEVLVNLDHIDTIQDAAVFHPNEEEVSLYIHRGTPSLKETNQVEFLLPMDFAERLKADFFAQKIDFYTDFNTYDRLFLDAKLDSLKTRNDIRLLLAGSSYTMCGLVENHMPLPARTIAVNSQDIYYMIRSIEQAIEYNPNLTHCVLSFAYYLWGCDVSKTSSTHLYPRIVDVNYPIFHDPHHFTGEVENAIIANSPYLKPITPLQKYLFPFTQWEEEKRMQTKKELAEAPYFSNERVGADFIHLDAEKNEKLTKMRTNTHNKFVQYKETIAENYRLFDAFLTRMEKRGIKITVFVPPMTSYYQQHTSEETISVFYEHMHTLQVNHSFTLIDLFASDAFQETDFFDYDHLNDRGAVKLGSIIGKLITD